jgi:hypothetical protein
MASQGQTCVDTPILDTLHFSVNSPSHHALNYAGLPVNDLAEGQPSSVALPPELVSRLDSSPEEPGMTEWEEAR